MAFVAPSNLESYQMDIKTAFLNGDLEKKFICSNEKVLCEEEHPVCKLKKLIYGFEASVKAIIREI